MRDTGIIFKTLTGDTEAVDRLTAIARTHIGILKHQMQLGDLKVGARSVPFPDGSAIRIVIAGGQTRVLLDAPPGVSGRPFELPTVELPLLPEYAAGSQYAVCVAAYPGLVAAGLYNPLPVVINGVQYADNSGRILGAGHVRFDWATVPNADMPPPASFVTAIYEMNKGVQASKYMPAGGSIIRNGQILQPIRRYVVRTVEDITKLSEDNLGVAGPYVIFGGASIYDYSPNASAQFNLSSPPWDSGVQLRIECSADQNVQPLVVDVPPGAAAFTVGGTNGGEISGTLTANNLSAPAPSGVNGLQGFIPFNDNAGYNLNITETAQSARSTGVGTRPSAGFSIEIGLGQPNWPPIDLFKPVQFVPGYGAKDAQVSYSVHTDIAGSGAITQPGSSATFLLVLQVQGGVTSDPANPWTGTTSGSLTGLIVVPDSWGGTRTIRVTANVTMTVS